MNTEKNNSPSQSEMLINRVKKNRKKLKAWLASEKVTCYRLYDKDIPEIPLAIDWYEGKLHVALYTRRAHEDEDAAAAWLDSVVPELADSLDVAADDVFIKQRRRGVGGTLYGRLAEKKALYEVEEGGHQFFVNLSDYLDTGLFLDHRKTRKMVEQEASGKRFLNLFAYTGAFSVYAAAGGAVSTTSVDMSNKYLDFAEANMALNGFADYSHSFVRDDILQILEERRVKEEYDLVVIDPPTISKSKSMKKDLDIQRDHAWLLGRVLEITAPGGVVYFSNNFQKFKFDYDAVKCSFIEEITNKTISPDFINRKPHRCFRLVR